MIIPVEYVEVANKGKCREPTGSPQILTGHAPAKNRGIDAVVGVQTVPGAIVPSTQERDHVGADVIFAKELQRLICRRSPAMSIGVNALLSCRQGKSPLVAAVVPKHRALTTSVHSTGGLIRG